MRFQFKQSYNADINLFRDSLAVRDYLIVLAVFMLAPMVMLSSGGGSTLLDFGTSPAQCVKSGATSCKETWSYATPGCAAPHEVEAAA